MYIVTCDVSIIAHDITYKSMALLVMVKGGVILS